MQNNKLSFLKEALQNLPSDWLNLTTHRLDIYDESQAKFQFLEQFDAAFNDSDASMARLSSLPTAYDYIRLGHPLSSVLEWYFAELYQTKVGNVISFSSATAPVLAILRKNLFENKSTHIFYSASLPACFNVGAIQSVYGYQLTIDQVESVEQINSDADSVVFIQQETSDFALESRVDFYVNLYQGLGSVILVNGIKNESYVKEIQHVRRRETIAMTPTNCHYLLESIVNEDETFAQASEVTVNKTKFLTEIKSITGTSSKAVVGSSGLSVQYAIMMGLIDFAQNNHPNKNIRFLVPPNCYGGTNDQAKRVAACLPNVEVLDLPVDREHNMVSSLDTVLENVAKEDAVPFIIAEIPTNPRVEVPELGELKAVLKKPRKTPNGKAAVESVFILDQTFCPNVQFLGDGKILSESMALSYVSGSKFPSGGKCTAGYCVSNDKATGLMDFIEKHLLICDNEATDIQYAFLAEQLPSMLDRIEGAYVNTRAFVNHIEKELPNAKINFVSEELASQGFTPSVFSLDLPTKGNTDEERETYKRKKNLELIDMMINQIPAESKYCVSYGQLKGCYWTIPATSTQGTTKEGDKDYIARVACSANMDLEKHKAVFSEFVEGL